MKSHTTGIHAFPVLVNPKIRNLVQLLIGLVLCSICGAANESTDEPPRRLNYQEVLRCGPNSLFVFLILSGHPEVTFKQIQAVPVTTDGSSLLALREAARRLGVETAVRFYSSNELDSIPLPAIGQLNTGSASVTRQHFDVIYKIDAHQVHFVNGTTGQKHSVRRLWFVEHWTGYAMTEPQSVGRVVQTKLASFPSLAFVLILDCCALTVCFFRRSSNCVAPKATREYKL